MHLCEKIQWHKADTKITILVPQALYSRTCDFRSTQLFIYNKQWCIMGIGKTCGGLDGCQASQGSA